MNAEPARNVLMVSDQVPPPVWPTAYDQVCVQVAHEGAPTYNGGFRLGDNAGHWLKAFGPERVAVWASVTPADTEDLSGVVAQYAPQAAYVILMVSGTFGRPWTKAVVERITGGFMLRMPDVPVGYSADGSPENCRAYGIDIDVWNRCTSVSVPQIYGVPAGANINAATAPYRNAHPMVSPLSDPSWKQVAEGARGLFSAVFWWRMGLFGWETWPEQLHTPAVPTGMRVVEEDPLRPDHRGRLPETRFIAYDGAGWWLTDLFRVIPLTLQQVERLHLQGLDVAYCPEVVQWTRDLI